MKMLSSDISRRRMLVGTSAVLSAPFILGRRSFAQERTINVGIWAGAQGEFIRKEIVPSFEEANSCRVLLDEGNTLAQLSKMRAEKANPRFTVMFVDDFAVTLARQEGLIERLPEDKIPNLSRVFDRYHIEDGHGVAVAMSACGMFYNKNLAEKPESYASLWSGEQSRLTVSSIRGTEGVYLVAAAAAVATGKPLQEAQYDGAAGFKQLAELKPKVLNIFSTPSQGASLVIEGEAAVGALAYSKWVNPYKLKGAPIEMSYAKEGTFPGVNCQVLVKNAPNQEIGAAFMNHMLSPEVQKPLSEYSVAAPTIRDVTIKDEVKGLIAYPEDELERLGFVQPDWKFLNRVRGEWTDEWNRIFTT